MAEQLIPLEIQEAYSTVPEATLLSGGMINRTVLAERNAEPVILQRLSPIFSEAQTDDYAAVVPQLREHGWEVPGLVTNVDGANRARDREGYLWRGLEFIASDESNVSDGDRSPTQPIAYGILLARLHQTLQGIQYEPTFRLPHFHDTDYYAEVLQSEVAHIPTSEGCALGQEILDKYTSLRPLPETADQLIHGDPRTANILHRDGEPFTFIDWDTLMKGTIWMDLGDMLRSICEDAVIDGKPVPMATLEQIAEGYRQIAFSEVTETSFREQAIGSAKRIALELAMRFIADYKNGDEGYFAYDEEAYSSRHQFTAERARLQMEIFNQLSAAEPSSDEVK